MSNIKATFTAGLDAITVHGLTQWDYGRKLEITHPDLPAILEVHFGVVGAQDAIVRAVESVVGVAEVSIPDALLEQSRPVLAWVYIVGETSGATMLTVTMPVQARARPAGAGPIPEAVSDKYTEALGAINGLVDSLKEGNVTVARALAADKATEAMKATNDGQGNEIAATYAKSNKPGFVRWSEGSILATNCLYQFMAEIAPLNAGDGINPTAISHRDPEKATAASFGFGYTLVINPDGTVDVKGEGMTSLDSEHLRGLYYRQI